MLERIAEIMKDETLMSPRPRFEALMDKKCIDFVSSPICHWRLKHGGRTIIIVNKKYAEDSDLIQGDYAIGYEG